MSKHIQRSAWVPYTPEHMFHLVNDVRSYPLFIPYCTGVEVISEHADVVVATVQFAKGFVKQQFTTENRLTAYSKIDMNLVAGPFSALKGQWLFEPQGQGCQIQFDLTFQFKNPLLQQLGQSAFEGMIGDMVQAFGNRAKVVYKTQP